MFDMPRPGPCPPLTQTPEYAAALRLMGTTVEAVPFGETVSGLMQARWWPLFGWLGLMSRGPIGIETLAKEELRSVLTSVGHPVIVTPQSNAAGTLRGAGLVQLLTPASVAELDLSVGEDTLRAGLHQKWRNRLVRAERHGLLITRDPLPIDPNYWLLKAEAAQRKAKRYRALPTQFALAYATANPGQALVYAAQENGQPIAGMLVLQHGRGATYHIGHTGTRGRQLGAHNLLMWCIARDLSARGYERMDLGVVNTDHAAGLARFKLGSGADLRRLGGTWLFSRALARFV